MSDAMRIYLRGGNGWGVSVGIVGALVVGVLVATTVFWVAAVAAAVLVLWLIARMLIALLHRRY
jgi:hypothetical protein